MLGSLHVFTRRGAKFFLVPQTSRNYIVGVLGVFGSFGLLVVSFTKVARVCLKVCSISVFLFFNKP